MRKARKNHFYRIKINSGKILKVRVDGVSLKKALSLIEKWVESNKQYQITTPNPEHIVLAQDDYRFRNILNNSDLSIPDGIGLVWAARMLKSAKDTSEVAEWTPRRWRKKKTFHRLSGVDLMLAMCKLAAKKNWRVFLLGGKNHAAKNAALKLKIKYHAGAKAEHPRLKHRERLKTPIRQTQGKQTENSKTKKVNNEAMQSQVPNGTWQSPASNGAGKQCNNELNIDYFSGSKNINNETIKERNETIKRINNFKPHFLFVAFGAPMQEKWIAKNLPILKVKVGMGVGGAFDYLSGRVKRAPKIIQKLNLEWFWRLICEPSRWRRQLRLVRFVWLVVKERLKFLIKNYKTN